MIEEAPEPKEVAHYHFSQLRTLKLVKANEQAPRDTINVVAAASKYGLLFVGISNGFKVLKLENILDLDEDKENKILVENYYSKVVATETPVLLSLSAEQKTLSVCVWRNASVVADMYDIGAFADPDENPVPFQTVQLSGNGCKLKEFFWNPVADGMYTYCLSDGSLYVHELSGMKLAVVASLPNAGANAVCWSPKGKQLVVGKHDGSFSQYKPTLQEVKNIPAPNINERLSVVNICWISTAQFAVLYVPESRNASPYLFIISTPKGSPVVYTNYYDVCLGNSSSDDQRYFLHHESAWGVLTCASTDSIEVAVLGDPPTWVQWELRDDGRALLPAKNGARYAIGMGVMYCSQRRIIISETESYLPMPVIFFLTDNGLLVPYHMVNSTPGSMSLVRPSTPIERDGERKRPDVSGNFGGQSSVPKSLPNMTAIPNVNPVSPMSSVFQPSLSGNVSSPAFTTSVRPAFGFGQNNALQRSESQLPSYAATPSFLNAMPPQVSTPSSIGVYGGLPTSGISPDAERFHKPSKGLAVNSSTAAVKRDVSEARHMAVAQRSSSGNKIDIETDVRPASVGGINLPPALTQPSNTSTSEKVVIRENLHNQDTYLNAIIEEMQTFNKEIQDLKKSSGHLTSIGSKEEMGNLQSFTLNFQEFQNEMTETMVSLNSDIHSLKNVLLESFVMVEEANSREKRKNDHSYLSMLKDRALDPMTAKRMQKIDQHYLYLSTQLQEVSNKLDQDWFEFLEKKKEHHKAVRHVSSTEAIYKTVVNNQKIIHNLRKNVDYISKKASEKKLENISNRRNRTQFCKRSGPEELSKLADAFLQAKITNSDEEKPQLTKKMSSESQDLLKKYLSSSSITSVRPTVVYSPSQSRLISKSMLYTDRPESNKFSTPLKENVQPITSPPALDKGLTITRTNVVTKSACSPPVLISSSVLNEKKLITINKPQVTSAFEFERLRLPDYTPNSNEQRVVEPSKDSINKPISKFTVPSMGYEVAQEEGSSPSSIEGPIYEEITPPDSPEVKNHPPYSSSDTKILQVSFSKSTPEVQHIDPATGFKKNLLTTFSERPQPQQQFLNTFLEKSSNPPPLYPSGTVPLQFGVQSSALGSLSDSAFKPNQNQSNVPSTIKQSTSTFSFLPTSAAPSFVLPLKNDENTSIGSSQTQVAPPQDTKLTFDVNSKLNPTTSTASYFGLNKPSSENKTASNNDNVSSVPQRSILSNLLNPDEGSKPLAPLQPTVISSTSLSTGAGKTSSFFDLSGSKETDQSKPFTFFQQNVESTTPEQPPISTDNSQSFFSNLTITNVKSLQSQEFVKTDDVTPTSSQTSQSEDVSSSDFKVTPSPVSSIPSSHSQSAFNQAPILSTQESKLDASETDTPVNLVSATSQSSTTFAATNLSLETTVASSLLDTKNTVSESEKTTASSSETLFSQGIPAASNSPLSPSSSSSVPQSSALASFTSAPAKSIFGQPIAPVTTQAAAVASTVSTSVSETPTTVSSMFDVAPNVIAPTSVFGQSPNTAVPVSSPDTVSSSAPVFGQASGTTPSFFGQTATSQSSFFGQQPPTTQSSFFGQTATTQSSFFGKAASETPQSSSFGAAVTTSGPFTQPAGAFFSQSSSGQTAPVFGSNSANATGNSGFGTQPASSGFSFGKSTFGQTQGSFGLAKSVFGQNSQAPAFGQPASPSAGAPFGQVSGTSAFGQGSFFSGLGGKPSAENASKNVFAVGNLGKPSSESTSVFGATGASSFGAKSGGAFTGGSFTAGGGSVAQSGFGAFQQTPQKTVSDAAPTNEAFLPAATGGFGAAPAFGGAPAFGSSPAFGSPPSFGAGSPLGSVFGSQQQQQQPTQTANFSSFATANAPTFGSLASQSPGGFGSPQQQPQQQPAFGQQTSPFGAAPVFGNAPSFGSQPSTFGAPSSPPGNASAFTQWRN